MQLKIIQIALGWKRERYSLEVSNWIRSKLRTPIATSRHELRWGGGEKHSTCIKYLSFCFGALACQYCHVVLPLTWGKPCFVHWHVPCQYVPSRYRLLSWHEKLIPSTWLSLPAWQKWPVQRKHAPCAIHLHHSNLSAGMLHDHLPSSLWDASIPCVTEHVSSMALERRQSQTWHSTN